MAKYDCCDWDELPKDAQAAAKTLGYNEKIWDSNGKAPSDSKDWDDLSEAEQAAAKVLGYDEDSWDE
jgi:hypothetical protein